MSAYEVETTLLKQKGTKKRKNNCYSWLDVVCLNVKPQLHLAVVTFMALLNRSAADFCYFHKQNIVCVFCRHSEEPRLHSSKKLEWYESG